MEWERTKPALALLIQQFIPKWKDLECAPPHHTGHWQPWPMAILEGTGSPCLHSHMYKPFNISVYLTTTSASVRRNEGCFNRRNSLKCKAKVPWTPDFCCALHCSGHRALLTWPSRDHCFLLMYVGNNFITTVLTKPPKWCFSCKRDACKDFFYWSLATGPLDGDFCEEPQEEETHSLCLCLAPHGTAEERVLTQCVSFNTFLSTSTPRHDAEKCNSNVADDNPIPISSLTGCYYKQQGKITEGTLAPLTFNSHFNQMILT